MKRPMRFYFTEQQQKKWRTTWDLKRFWLCWSCSNEKGDNNNLGGKQKQSRNQTYILWTFHFCKLLVMLMEVLDSLLSTLCIILLLFPHLPLSHNTLTYVRSRSLFTASFGQQNALNDNERRQYILRYIIYNYILYYI